MKNAIKNLRETMSQNTRQLFQNNAKLGAVNKVLAKWQLQDKVYHNRKENSDRALEKKLDKIIELLKNKKL